MTIEPLSQRFRTEAGVQLHCLCWSIEKEGDHTAAAPIVLLHGGGANAHWWDHIASEIASHRPVYALDFRGHGDSAFPNEHYVGAFNDDLEAILTWLGREDVILIGHSLGAAVALDHASRFPITRGIVLIDLARGGTPGSGRRARLALSLRRTYRTRDEATRRFRFLPESSEPTEALRKYIAERSVQVEPDGRFGYKFDPAWFGLPTRPHPDPTAIRTPTLLVRGGDSTLLSSEAAQHFVSQLGNGQLVEIPASGHHVLIDQPGPLLSAIERFIKQVD